MKIGRPETTEAAPYYFTYIDQVAGDDPLATIERQLEDTVVLFSGISEEELLTCLGEAKSRKKSKRDE